MRWWWYLLLFLGLAAAAALWLLGPLLGLESTLLRVLLSALLALITPLVLLLGYLQRRRAAAPTGPVASADFLRAVTGRLDKLATVLKDSRRVHGAGEGVHQAPWYLLLGPAGAGKTSAVRGTGEGFFSVVLAGEGVPVDVYAGKSGVVFDVSGKLAVDREDSATHVELRALYRALVARNPRGIEGVVLALSLDSVLGGDPRRLEAETAAARLQLEGLRAVLGRSPPVFVLFTHADRWLGFADAFAVLSSSDRSRGPLRVEPFGAGLDPLAPKGWAPALEALFLHQRQLALARLPILDDSFRASTFEVIEQLEASVPLLLAALERLARPSKLGEGARLAGVYAASALQDGRVIDVVGGRLAESFALRGRATDRRSPDQRSYFLREVFSKVLFAARPRPPLSVEGKQRLLRTSYLLAAGAALFGLGGSAAFFVSWSENRALQEDARQVLERAAEPRTDDPAELKRALGGLAEVAGRIDELDRWERRGPPLALRFGLYQGTGVRAVLTEGFTARAQGAFVQPVNEQVLASLSDPKGSDDPSADYDRLKAYLMAAEEAGRMSADFAAPVIVEEWRLKLPPDVREEKKTLERIAHSYLRLIGERRARWAEVNEGAKLTARKSLLQRGAEFRRMVADPARGIEGKQLIDLVGARPADVLTASYGVEGLYTLKGWRAVRGRLGDTPEGVAPWVLGQYTQDNELAQALSEQYFVRFRDEWMRFLRGLKVRPPADLPEARSLIRGLTEGTAVYVEILEKAQAEMGFPTLAEDAAEAAQGQKGALAKVGAKVDKLLPDRPPNLVQEHFAKLFELVHPKDPAATPPLPDYIQKLRALGIELTKFEEQQAADLAPLRPVVDGVRERAELILASLPEGPRSVMEPLLLNPIRGVMDTAAGASARRVSSSFRASVCDVFYENLAGRYPFAESRDDAVLDAVKDFFATGGTLWAFFDQHLAADVERAGERFLAKGTKPIEEEILEFLSVGWHTKSALFPGEAKELAREFQLTPQAPKYRGTLRATAVVLEVGGNKYRYAFGPEQHWNVVWPAKGTTVRLSLEGLQSAPVEEQGDWALFRFIERGRAVAQQGGAWEVTWSIGEVDVPIVVRSRTGSVNPLFGHERWQRLRCTRSS